MEALFGLLSLVFLVGAVLGIFAFRKALKLEKQVLQLRDEMALLRTPSQSSAAKSASVVPKVAAASTTVPAKTSPAPATKAPSPSAVPAAPASQLKPKKRGFVDELGARWSVWVGGLALALGAIFLLRYSIEAGLFSPALRVALTAMLGLSALAAGEWLGRSDPAAHSEITRRPYIPGVLTAVGILALFGSVYASYALYGFIGPTPAFGLMGALSLAGLALGLRQGPAMSGLGLAGSLVTPWLVSTPEPSFGGLYVYLLIVAAGALILARYRDWAWLSVAAAAGGMVWALIGLGLHANHEFWLWTLYVAALTTLTIVLNANERLPLLTVAPNWVQAFVLPLACYAAAGHLLIAMMYEDLFSPRSFYTCLAAGALGLAAAWHWSRMVGASLLSGALVMVAILARGAEVGGGTWMWPAGGFYIPSPLEGEWARVFAIAAITSGVLIAISALCATKQAASVKGAATIWSITGAVFPLLMFFLLWLIGARGVPHLPFALAGLGLAAALAGAVEWLFRQMEEPAADGGPIAALPLNIFAGAACLATFFAITAGLSGLNFSVALMIAVPAIAAITARRHLWILRVASPVFGAALALHVLYSVAAFPDAVGPRVLFNELWIYFALPALAAGVGRWFLGRLLADKWSQALEALALALTALFAVFQVRHYMNAGDLFASELSLEELGLQVLVSLCFSLGLSRIKDVGPRSLFSIGAMAAMGVSLLSLVFGVLISLNPFFNATVEIEGGYIFNSLLLSYLLPGLLLGAIAWLQQTKRPGWYLKTLGGVSLACLVAYMTTMVRFGYHGGEDMALTLSPVLNTEQYTYSIVWLLFGIALLMGGMVFKVRELRIGSAAVMMLTAAKVFLIDMSALEGILRALSFVGLGAVLIGMGLVYQRVLSSDEAPVTEGKTT
ncbi:MAG: DUF2339 domain-containing protein [Pseudomonadota bacterium]